MPNWSSNDPRQFGWTLSFRGFVPFTFQGHNFPQGVHPLVAPIFTAALERITANGLQLPPVAGGLANGEWGQEDRPIAGSSTISYHQYGLAIDVNAPWNPWGVQWPTMSRYRLPDNTSALVEPLGLLWGGSPRFAPDYDRMHLECHLSPSEITALRPPGPPGTPGTHPYPLPSGAYYGPYSGPANSISGSGRLDAPYRPGLQLAQAKLRVVADGYYGPATAAATRTWQQTHHLYVDGLIGPVTWRSLGV